MNCHIIQLFRHQVPVLWKTIFPQTIFSMEIREHYIYCALHFYYYYISSTTDQQALDPGGWGTHNAYL